MPPEIHTMSVGFFQTSLPRTGSPQCYNDPASEIIFKGDGRISNQGRSGTAGGCGIGCGPRLVTSKFVASIANEFSSLSRLLQGDVEHLIRAPMKDHLSGINLVLTFASLGDLDHAG